MKTIAKTGHITAVFLICAISAVHAHAQEIQPDPIKPRIEAGVRAGTERTIGVTEVWFPFAQDSDAVLYGDVRYMSDDDENREGNLGVGYRVLDNNFVWGVHGWIDRRKTERGSIFHQVTLGGEMLGEDLDGRINLYAPLNKRKSYNTANIGSTTPYLADTGIYVDTNGRLVEEAQKGIDAEIGWRLPFAEDYIDTARIYGGVYKFSGDDAPDVNGVRTRLVVDVTPWFSVGASMQHDDVRGSQSFATATLRFPVAAKRSFKQQGLRARLDESPERDIDIVSGSKQVDTGLRKPVINADSGQVQRIMYVDNTAASGGDGSRGRPFNTLAAAQSAQQDNDIIYIRHGDGTVTGMDHGLTMHKNNVTVIGSGVDFVYDGSKYSARTGGNYNGAVLEQASAAPVITNIDTDNDVNTLADGNGFYLTGLNPYISGVNIEGAANAGIRTPYLLAGQDLGSVYFDTMQISNNTFGSIDIQTNGARIDSISLSNITADHNGEGLKFTINGGYVGSITADNITVNNTTGGGGGAFLINVTGGTGRVDTIDVSHITTNNNSAVGILLQIANASGTIGTLKADHLTANNNVGHGVHARLAGVTGVVDSLEMTNVVANGNGDNNGVINNAASGLQITVGGNGTNRGVLTSLKLDDISTTGNKQDGVTFSSNGYIIAADVRNITANDNGRNGVSALPANGGSTTIDFANVTANDNTIHGMQLSSNVAGSTGLFTVDNLRASNNDQSGLLIQANAGTNMTASVENSVITGNKQSGVYINDDTTATFVVDLGGGAVGSTGHNTLHGNRLSAPGTYGDVQADLDLNTDPLNGMLVAQDNYWGQPGGPIAGQFKSDASPHDATIDASGALAADPN